MLAISRGPAGAADWRGTLLARQLLWLIAPLSFLLLLWDVQGRHRKVSASQLLSLAPRRGAFAPGFHAQVPGSGNLARLLLTHEPGTPLQAPPRPRARPRPPPQLRSREPGCWIPSLRLVLHFHKRAALRRAEIAAAASPRGAPPRRAPPGPHQSARGPRGSAAGGEPERRGRRPAAGGRSHGSGRDTRMTQYVPEGLPRKKKGREQERERDRS